LLRDHPEIKELYGQHPWSALLTAVIFVVHAYMAYYFALYSWPVLIIGSYTVGAWMAFVLQTVGHDATHRLVFKSAGLNKLVALVTFLQVFLGPFGSVWMYEHMWHHNVVVDKCIRYGPQSNPTLLKAFMSLMFMVVVQMVLIVASTTLGATLLVTIPLGLLGLRKSLYPATFGLPPFNRFPQSLNGWMAANIFACWAYNIAMIYFFGWKAFAYHMLSALWMNGFHPLGMRQVQEHYFIQKGQPTNSVYTSVHTYCLNVGYHVEHHDFAAIPWNRLPLLTKIAPEYYTKDLKYYTSYTQVLFEFLFNKGIPLSALFDDGH